MPKKALILVVFLSSLVILAACSGSNTPVSLIDAEEQQVIPEIPDQYAELSNLYKGNADAIALGEMLYMADCSSCHGNLGHGDGPASAGLEPEPTDLARTQSNLSDAYLFWRISEGGLMEPFNSLMPRWEGLLQEEQIWQVIAYLRTLEG